MQFTTLFVGATTVALALASPLDLAARGGSTTSTTVNNGCGNQATQTNAYCCAGTTDATTPIASSLISLLGLDNVLAGAKILGTGCGSVVGSTCSNKLVCCDGSSGPVSGTGLIGIGVGINAPCLLAGAL